MLPLNLPQFDLKQNEGEVLCLVRKKWVALTPEEWVRQHFLNLLINHLSYPKGMMRLEHAHTYFKNQKRSDITILKKNSRIFLLVECKAPTVAIDQKTVNQVSTYNKVLDADYLAVSNGLKHFIWKKEEDGFIQKKEFPTYF